MTLFLRRSFTQQEKKMSLSAYTWYFVVPVYYFLGVVYLLFGAYNKRFVKCLLKCLPLAVLLIQMLTVFGEHINQSKEVAPLRHFLWGLVFSAIGDGCLVFRKIFVIGIISFGVSLCFYISSLEFVELIQDIGPGGGICGLCIMLMTLGFILLFRLQKMPMRLKTLTKLVLAVLIVLYFIVLSLLLWSGVLLFLRRTDLAGICATIGAMMFYVSDVLIAAGAIWDFRVLQGRVLVMLTYYSAQILLAISLHLKLQDS